MLNTAKIKKEPNMAKQLQIAKEFSELWNNLNTCISQKGINNYETSKISKDLKSTKASQKSSNIEIMVFFGILLD